MAVATLTLQSTPLDPEPLSMTFDTFPSPEGYPSFQDEHDEEELTSPGIDGKRWRTVFDQFPPLMIEAGNPAWSAVATHSAACDLADKMRRCKGRFGSLVIVSGGTRTIILKVHVTAVLPRVNPGAIIGPGISGAACVASAWTFDILDS